MSASSLRVKYRGEEVSIIKPPGGTTVHQVVASQFSIPVNRVKLVLFGKAYPEAQSEELMSAASEPNAPPIMVLGTTAGNFQAADDVTRTAVSFDTGNSFKTGSNSSNNGTGNLAQRLLGFGNAASKGASDGGVPDTGVLTSPELLAQTLVEQLGGNFAATEFLSKAIDYINIRLSRPLSPTGTSGLSPNRGSETRTFVHNDDGGRTEISAFADEEDISREQLMEIKARTMYNMVEEVEDGRCKLLFLTNPQADLIAETEGGVRKMLDALEGKVVHDV